MIRQSANTRSRRRGLFSMELVLVLPILGTLLLGLFEFSLLFFARGEVVDASRAGARSATLPGATLTSIEEEVLATLSPRLRERAEVVIQPGVQTGDPVIVGVRVPMSAAAPDLLWPVGFQLRDRYLASQTQMTKE
ncbi:MAG: pilus assembly protein [Planctomycetaceae bacterium]